MIQLVDQTDFQHSGAHNYLECSQRQPPSLDLPYLSVLDPPLQQTPNLDLRSTAHSPVNVLNLNKYLAKYPDRLAAFELFKGFTYGS